MGSKGSVGSYGKLPETDCCNRALRVGSKGSMAPGNMSAEKE